MVLEMYLPEPGTDAEQVVCASKDLKQRWLREMRAAIDALKLVGIHIL